MKATEISRKNTDRYKVPVVIAICLAVFLLCLVLGNVSYETNDDEGLNLIAVGGYGKPVSQYLVFINILYSLVLKGLFYLIPQVNWYLWLLLVFDLLGMICVCTAAAKRLDRLSGIVFTLAMNLILYRDLYNAVQYTKSAMWYGAVGAALLYCAVKDDKGMRSGAAAGGAFFFFLSVLVRDLCAYISAVAFAAVMGIELLTDWIRSKKISVKGDYIKAVAVIALVIIGAQVAQKIGYSSNEWRYYFDLYDARQELLDYGLPAYDRDKFQEIGVSEISYTMLEDWIFNDPEFFDLEKMEQIVAIKAAVPTYRLDSQILGRMAFYLKAAFDQFRTPYIFAGLGLILLILRKWKALLVWVAQLACIIAEYWYLCCVNRVVVRVVFGLWAIPITVVFMYTALQYKWEKNIPTKIVFVILAVLMCLNTFRFAQNFVSNKHGQIADNRKSSTEAFIDEINRRDDGFYIGNTDAFYRMISGSPYRVNCGYEDFYENFALIGGWEVSTPVGDYYLHERGIENAMKALFERDDVYYVDNSGSEMLILRYLQEIYDPKITMSQVDEICGFKVYKYSGG